jgi:hypothetical protein
MAKASRDKGARGEREVARVFTAAGLPADRTAALQAGGVPGAGDVTIRELPSLHVESKRTEKYTLPEWLAQVEAATLPGQPYVIAFRRSHAPWRGVVDLAWLADLLAELAALRHHAAKTSETNPTRED